MQQCIFSTRHPTLALLDIEQLSPTRYSDRLFNYRVETRRVFVNFHVLDEKGMERRRKFPLRSSRSRLIVLDRGLMARLSIQFIPLRVNKIFMEESYRVRN